MFVTSSVLRLKRALCAALLLTAAYWASAQPLPLRGISLLDQQGRAIQSASLADQPVLLNFVFTGCSATCPTQTRELAALHEALPATVRSRVRFLSVSVDPAHDTPRGLAAFAKRMGADRAGWRFATGDAGQVDALIDRLQVLDRQRPDPGPQDHRTSLYLFDAGGNLVQRYAGVPVDRVRLAAEINALSSRPLPTR